MSRAFPDGMDEQARDAGSRVLSRQAPPRVKITRGKSGWKFDSPYGKEHENDWHFLLLDAFGTRHGSVLDHFLGTISELVPEGDRWVAVDKRAYWYPSESDFNAVLAIVSAMRPENEAQAAHAAQCAALHLASMKVGRLATQSGCQRSTAILAKASRAYGEGMERLARLQGKAQVKQVNQTIQVVYVDNRSNVLNTGGVRQNGGQPQEPYGSNTPAQWAGDCHERRAALPRPCPDNGEAMPGASGEREAGLPSPRWGQRIWRAIWGTQRKLEARRLEQ